MKDLKEKILIILVENIDVNVPKNSPCYPTAINGIPKSAQSITTLIEKDYYLKEFMVWTESGDHEFYPGIRIGEPIWFSENPEREYTLDELYEYWLKEVKK